MKKTAMWVGLVTQLCLAVAPAATLNYQGRLVGTGGTPVNGSLPVAVKLYADAAGGTPLYAENVGPIVVQNGIFSFNWGAAGTSVVTVTELVGVTTGSGSTLSTTTQHHPINSGSVLITDGTYSWRDTTGSSHPANYLGTVSSYANGTVSAIYLGGNPPAGIVNLVTYKYNSTGCDATLQGDSTLYLSVTVNGSVLNPRRLVGDVPRSVVAETVKGQTLFVDDMSGRVGILTNNPSSPLTVNGVVESRSGGFRFPDGTIQSTSGLTPATQFGGDVTGTFFSLQIQENNLTESTASLLSMILDLVGRMSVLEAQHGITSPVSDALVCEIFTSPAGYLGLVDRTNTAASFLASQEGYVPNVLTNSAGESGTISLGRGAKSAVQVLTNLNAYASSAGNSMRDLDDNGGRTYPSAKFFYLDGTSAEVSAAVLSSKSYTPRTYANPSVGKLVSHVVFYMGNDGYWNGDFSQVKDAYVSLISSPRVVVLNIPPVTGTVTEAMLSVIARRESGDSIAYALSSGGVTNSALSLNTKVSVANLPSSSWKLHVFISASPTNTTFGTTALQSITLKRWVQQ